MKNTIFSLGHSNKSFEVFLEKLEENDIDTVVDVRTTPRSRFCPQFNEKRLATALQDQNITYLFKGNNLGGKGENIDYDKAINALVEMSNGKNVCVICSEGKHVDCHRHSMIEPSLREKGVEMVHIEYT